MSVQDDGEILARQLEFFFVQKDLRRLKKIFKVQIEFKIEMK